MPFAPALNPLIESPVYGLLLFAAFFLLFALAFCRGDIRQFTRGLLRLAQALLTAPFHFVDAATRRVIEFATQPLEHRKDRQYLIRTLLMISNGAILLFGIGILAGGGAAAWRIFAPEEVRAARAAAAEAVPNAEKAVEESRKRLADVDARLGQPSPAEKRIEELRKALEADRKTLSEQETRLDAAAYSEWPPVKQHLERNLNVSGDWQLDQLTATVNSFVEPRMTPPGLDEVKAFVATWVKVRRGEAALAQAERGNPRSAMLREKAEIQEELKGREETLADLRRRASYERVFEALNPGLALLAMLSALAAFLSFIWGAGLLVESTGLLVDIAANIRRMREHAVPHPGDAKAPPTA